MLPTLFFLLRWGEAAGGHCSRSCCTGGCSFCPTMCFWHSPYSPCCFFPSCSLFWLFRSVLWAALFGFVVHSHSDAPRKVIPKERCQPVSVGWTERHWAATVDGPPGDTAQFIYLFIYLFLWVCGVFIESEKKMNGVTRSLCTIEDIRNNEYPVSSFKSSYIWVHFQLCLWMFVENLGNFCSL